MRLYNSETDFPLLVKSCKDYGAYSIAGIAKTLRSNGIRFPEQFNKDTSPTAIRLDADILKAWYEHEPEPEPCKSYCGDPYCNGRQCWECAAIRGGCREDL